MIRLLPLAVLLFLASIARGDDWPQWLGPKRDSASSEKIAPWKDAPKLLWRHPAGPGYSVPVAAGGRVFVHERIPDKDEERVVCYDAVSGKELWSDTYGRSPYVSTLNTGPQATPAVAAGRVYTFGITGILSCYRADSGKRLWQIDAHKQFKAPLPQFGVTCSPLVAGNRLSSPWAARRAPSWPSTPKKGKCSGRPSTSRRERPLPYSSPAGGGSPKRSS